jgi:hypothetical protein
VAADGRIVSRFHPGADIMTSTARKPLPFPPRTLQQVPIRPLKMPSIVRSAPRRAPADQKLVERVRREFSDLRGLSPTMAQARRLFHLAEDECLEIFRQLLLEGFLVLCPDDRYRLKTRHHR